MSADITPAEFVEICYADCEMAAQDVRNSADYLAFSYKQKDAQKASEHLTRLQERMLRLQSEVSSLQRALEQPEQEACHA